jgi:hypothetical protein
MLLTGRLLEQTAGGACVGGRFSALGLLQEEVMPSAVSQGNLLAPEEIFRKKKKTSELKGEAEVVPLPARCLHSCTGAEIQNSITAFSSSAIPEDAPCLRCPL